MISFFANFMMFLICLEKIFPLKLLVINKLRPQFSNAIKNLRIKKDKSCKKWKASKNPSDYLKFKKLRLQYKTQVKT